MSNKMLRIAVIYDGNYFRIVSNYYNYNHPRRSYLSIGGLHEFVRQKAARFENVSLPLVQIVDAHYFRGRMWAQEASQHANRLYRERVMDDILMAEGVTQHNLPLRNIGGRKGEKGIDVWLALETYELAVLKKFDVIALFAADGDYVPLVRKLNTLGIRVMLMGWDFETMTEGGFSYVTRYSRDLAWECSYPIEMHPEIEMGLMNRLPLVNNLFPREGFLADGETAGERTTGRKVFRPRWQGQNPMPDNYQDDPAPLEDADFQTEMGHLPTETAESRQKNGQNGHAADLAQAEKAARPADSQIVEPMLEPAAEPVVPDKKGKKPAPAVEEKSVEIEAKQAEILPEKTVEMAPPPPPVEPELVKIEAPILPTAAPVLAAPTAKPAPAVSKKPVFEEDELDEEEDLLAEQHYHIGTILKLFNGYGFIEKPPHNVFFHYTHLYFTDFHSLQIGDAVEYLIDPYKSTDDRYVARSVSLI